MSCSFVILPSKKVIELAYACLDRIQAYKDKAWEDKIKEELEAFDKSWIRKRISSRPTEAEIRASLMQERDLITWVDIIDLYAWKSQETAEKLLIATRYTDTVHVSVEDLDLIKA